MRGVRTTEKKEKHKKNVFPKKRPSNLKEEKKSTQGKYPKGGEMGEVHKKGRKNH